MFSFKNIDSFIPSRFERMGVLKGKRWYISTEETRNVLFKPQRQEFGDKKVFCANHYGELMGYILTLGTELPACRCELAHLSKYYENIHKEMHHGTAIEKDGCITYSDLKPREELEHGNTVIEYLLITKNKKLFEKLTNGQAIRNNEVDNIEVILASIEERTRDFYSAKSDISSDYIEEKVAKNKKRAIQMMVYDCLYGNNDRHDENWAMRRNADDIEMYPLYDNERVLGLYENQTLVENAVKNKRVEAISEEVLFSRMRVPGETKRYSSYKDVLNYLMDNYRSETSDALLMFLSCNTPTKINKCLISCEGLPSCYVDFGTAMYQSRFEAARELYRTKILETNKTMEETEGLGDER